MGSHGLLGPPGSPCPGSGVVYKSAVPSKGNHDNDHDHSLGALGIPSLALPWAPLALMGARLFPL